MTFSPSTTENDELLHAIEADISAHDDDWQLSERPDTEELTQYWTQVEDDIRHDPEWIRLRPDE